MSISAGYTEHELRRLWTFPESQRTRLLRPALARLYENPNVSESYLTEWTSTLRESVQFTLGQNVSLKAQTTPRGGHEPFVRSCMDAGLATAMLKVSELTTPASKRARIHALSIWCGVATIASKTPEHSKQLNNTRIDIKKSLLKCLKSKMFMQRAQAILCLRQFAYGPWAKNLSQEHVAEIMVACLLYACANEQSVLEELKTRDLGWQRELMREMEDMSDVLNVEEALAFAPRFYSQSRDIALQAVGGLLYGRDTRNIRRDCRDIIELVPQILDKLLTIVCFERTPWHPESVADSTAAQILAYLLQTPHCTIPELWDEMASSRKADFPPGARGESDVRYVTEEWIAQRECWEDFVKQCPRWRQRILEKWNRLQNETRTDILRLFRRTSKYKAVEVPDAAELENAISERGICRSCILRICVNMTDGGFGDHKEGEVIVSTPDLLSLLPMAYEASQKIPSEARSKRHANGPRGRDGLLRLERTRDVFVIPPAASHGTSKSLACSVVFSEYILGPVLLFRILRRINEAKDLGIDTDVASWTSLPQGTPENAYLGQIQQIASSDVVDILMRNVILKRIPSQKDEGTQRLRQKYEHGDVRIEADYARSAYLAAAELAVAVDQFYASAGPYKKTWDDMMGLVKKERLACLGNVSEMSSRLGEWTHQYWYARHAIGTVDGLGSDILSEAKRDGWDPEGMRAKNERRLTTAKSSIVAHK